MFVNDILKDLAEVSGVPVSDLVSETRVKDVSQVRQAGYYLYRVLRGISYPRIARAFRRLDHTSVIHGVNAVQRDMVTGKKTIRTKTVESFLLHFGEKYEGQDPVGLMLRRIESEKIAAEAEIINIDEEIANTDAAIAVMKLVRDGLTSKRNRALLRVEEITHGLD